MNSNVKEDNASSIPNAKDKLRYISEAISLVFYASKRHSRCGNSLDRLEPFFLLLLVLSGTYEYNATRIGFSSAAIFRYMITRDITNLVYVLGKMMTFAIHSALCISAKAYVIDVLARILRESLTNTLNEKYFGQESYHRLSRTIDNPDQRITVDVQEFSSLLILTVDKFLLSPILLVYYSYRVVLSTGKAALLALYVFFGFGILLQRLVLPFVIKQTKKMDQLEGDYRFAHATLRNESESIYLSKTGRRFHAEVDYYFNRLLSQYPLVLALRFMVNLIGNIFAYAGGVANYAALYFCVDLSAFTAAEMSAFISQGSFITLMLISKLTDFVQLGDNFSDMAAYSQRIVEFYHLASERDYSRQWNMMEEDQTGTTPAISFMDLDLCSPDLQCHIRNLTLHISYGQNVFITGPNGSGKTSLVRIMMRMWTPTRGRVLIQGRAKLACAPQEAIVYSGTLLEQLGLSNDLIHNEEATRILRAVKLNSLAFRCGGFLQFWPRTKWTELLSPGEIQRLALCRVLLEQPHFAILDEATSAIDLDTESLIYSEFWRRGITTITIAHRLSAKLSEKMTIFVILDGQGNHVIRNQGEQLAFESFI